MKADDPRRPLLCSLLASRALDAAATSVECTTADQEITERLVDLACEVEQLSLQIATHVA